MREYTKHNIKRIRDLNDRFFEVVIGKGSLKFFPGTGVKLYGSGDTPPLFICSGMQEPWIRLILDRDLFPNFDFEQRNLKLSSEIHLLLPDLAAEEKANFVVDATGIGAFFAYASTFPSTKCKVCYLGADRIQEDWVKFNHTVVDMKTIRKADNVFVIGERDLMERKASKVLATCKGKYLI